MKEDQLNIRNFHKHSKKYKEYLKSMMISPSLNLGCGHFKICDVNVDMDKSYNPDIVHDLNQVPYNFGKFNTILLHHSLEHLEDPDKVLKEIHKILNHEGKMIIVVPSPLNKNYESKNHKYFFTKSSLMHLVRKYFYKEIIFGYRGDTKNYPIFLNKLIGRIFPNQFICIAQKSI